MKIKSYLRKKLKLENVCGIVHINSTFNNTIINITDSSGNTISWSSSGSNGFKGARKGTPFAAQIASESAIKKAIKFGLEDVKINLKGQGPGRETAICAIKKTSLNITEIIDINSIPHNGCRPPQKRKV